jgi:alpha-ribazole phosphatase/probable phosphoglycerate mutase
LSKATRLLLIRHAQPETKAGGRCYGSLDVGLSARGQRLARQLGRVLEGIPFTAVYTSPLQRATLTAGPLAAANGLTPTVVDNLRELDFGAFEGRRYDDIAREYPALFAAWMNEPTTVRFPNGEDFTDLRTRVLAATAAIRKRHAGEVVAVVSHGGVIRTVLADALDMPAAAIFRLEQSYGALSIVDWLDETPIVRLVNGRPTMVGRRRRGFLPGLVQAGSV